MASKIEETLRWIKNKDVMHKMIDEMEEEGLALLILRKEGYHEYTASPKATIDNLFRMAHRAAAYISEYDGEIAAALEDDDDGDAEHADLP